MRLLVVQPDNDCTADRFATWLDEVDAELVVCAPADGHAVPTRVDADGLLVLGGDMGALDDDEYPWLADVRLLLAASVHAGVPVLGICLGAQLLAAACGGRVEVGVHGVEAGVVDVRWRDEASYDVLFAGLPDPFPGPSLHGDSIVELPPGAAWLGETDLYSHQAFRVGDRAWGVQFHPEVSLESLTSWSSHLTAADWAKCGRAHTDVVDEMSRCDGEVIAAGRALAHRFAAVVDERAQQWRTQGPTEAARSSK
jgi:GMP synthase (glutamine-hydrolysing)